MSYLKICTYQIGILLYFFPGGKLKNKSPPMQIHSSGFCWVFSFSFFSILFHFALSFCDWNLISKKCRQMYRRLTFPLACCLETYKLTPHLLNHSSWGVSAKRPHWLPHPKFFGICCWPEIITQCELIIQDMDIKYIHDFKCGLYIQWHLSKQQHHWLRDTV